MAAKSAGLLLMLIVCAHIIPVGCLGEDATVPFETLSHLLIVKAKVNGSQADYNFVVDTGGVACIDLGLAKELGLKQKGMMAKIDSLDLPGFRIDNVFCFTTFDFNHFDALGTPLHGIIGSNLLDRYRVTLDFRSRSLTFSGDTTALECPEGAVLMPFRSHPVNSAPVVDFRVGTMGYEGMIDTGQPYAVVFPMRSLGPLEDSLASGPIRSVGLMEEWPMTNPECDYLARLEVFGLGSLEIDSVVCLFADLPPLLSMPLIGDDLLSQFTLVIDYPRHEMLMLPYGEVRPHSNHFSAGLNPDLREDGRVIVKGLWQGSPADQAGIEVGDVILSFESREATRANLIELIGLLEDDATEAVTLKVAGKDGAREVRLVKAMLF